jgi:hypothetical protein
VCSLANFGKANIPKPFSRPSIELATPAKAWRHVQVVALEAGDIVAEYGIVKKIFPNYSETGIYFLEVGEKSYLWEPDREVFAFTKKESHA